MLLPPFFSGSRTLFFAHKREVCPISRSRVEDFNEIKAEHYS